MVTLRLVGPRATDDDLIEPYTEAWAEVLAGLLRASRDAADALPPGTPWQETAGEIADRLASTLRRHGFTEEA